MRVFVVVRTLAHGFARLCMLAAAAALLHGLWMAIFERGRHAPGEAAWWIIGGVMMLICFFMLDVFIRLVLTIVRAAIEARR